MRHLAHLMGGCLLVSASAQCIDDDKQMLLMTGGSARCADVLAAKACLQDVGGGQTIAGLNICQCSCPLSLLAPPPTRCKGGGNSSGSLLADDPQCCNVPGWTDELGNTCKDYVVSGWCCKASVNPGCNSKAHMPGGLDPDHGCCASCANNCYDDDDALLKHLDDLSFGPAIKSLLRSRNLTAISTCAFLTSPILSNCNKTRPQRCAEWKAAGMWNIEDICSCSCVHPPAAERTAKEACENGVLDGGETFIDCGGPCKLCEPGCTVSSASNYNASARDDDGSCAFDFYPCTDQVSTTYDPTATADYSSQSQFPDGACHYTLHGILEAVGATPCPSAGPDFKQESKMQQQNSPAASILWNTPCRNSTDPALMTHWSKAPAFYDSLQSFRDKLDNKDAPNGPEVSSSHLHVVQFTAVQNATIKWGTSDIMYTIHLTKDAGVILHGNPSRPCFKGRWNVNDGSFFAVRFVTFREYYTQGANPGEVGMGGAIKLDSNGRKGAVAQIVSCYFINLGAEISGGAVRVVSSGMYVESSYFYGCHSQDSGAISVRGDLTTRPARLVVKSCAFVNNTAHDNVGSQDQGKGGAIGGQDAGIVVVDSTFKGNQADPDTPTMDRSGFDLKINDGIHVLIQGTSFEPYREVDSIRLTASRIETCRTHPCRKGYGCSVENASLWCKPCPAGTYGDDGFACQTCHAGQGPNADQAGCEKCVGANFSTTGTCQPCPTPNVIDKHHTLCTRCRAGELANSDRTGCTSCQKGYYSPRGTECVNCAAADFRKLAVCPGGSKATARPYPRPGWWMDYVANSSKLVALSNFYQCFPPDVCHGYVDGDIISETCSSSGCCKVHHSGPLCGVCAQKTGFIESNGRCVRCEGTIWWIIGCMLLAYVALACYLEKNSCAVDLSKQGSTLAIMTFYGQTLALLASDNFYGITALVNLDLQYVDSDDGKRCIIATPPLVASCTGMLFVPAFLCVVVWRRSRGRPGILASDAQPNTPTLQQPMLDQLADMDSQPMPPAAAAAAAAAGSTDEPGAIMSVMEGLRVLPPQLLAAVQPAEAGSIDRKHPTRALLEVLLFSYFGTTKKALDIFSCIHVGNQNLVAIDKRYQCHAFEHLVAEGLGVVVLVMITFTVPVVIVYKAYKHRVRGKSLHDVTFARTISLFHARYNWWMAWLLTRRVLIAATFVYGHGQNNGFQVGGGAIDWRAFSFVVLVFSATLQNWCQPFLLPADNRLEQTTLQMLIFALYVDMADTSGANEVARFGVLVSILVVTSVLLVGDAPIVKKVKYAVRNPRVTLALAKDKAKTAGLSSAEVRAPDTSTSMHANTIGSTSTLSEQNPVAL